MTTPAEVRDYNPPTITAQVPSHGTFTAATVDVEILMARWAGKTVRQLRQAVEEYDPHINWSLCSWVELLVILASFGSVTP